MMRKDFWSDILIFLDDSKHPKASFEEIRKGVGGSPRTINHHLRKLYEEELIKKEWGRRGRYYLTDEGMANACYARDLRGTIQTIESLPNDILQKVNEFLKNLHGWLQRKDVRAELTLVLKIPGQRDVIWKFKPT